nr:Scr1 family TA system antitoxin-like transcriptional regulator [Micromonospora trifolii]
MDSVLSEAVLRRGVGGPTVMTAQLDHLLRRGRHEPHRGRRRPRLEEFHGGSTHVVGAVSADIDRMPIAHPGVARRVLMPSKTGVFDSPQQLSDQRQSRFEPDS